jgi:hypothetical protein
MFANIIALHVLQMSQDFRLGLGEPVTLSCVIAWSSGNFIAVLALLLDSRLSATLVLVRQVTST